VYQLNKMLCYFEFLSLWGGDGVMYPWGGGGRGGGVPGYLNEKKVNMKNKNYPYLQDIL